MRGQCGHPCFRDSFVRLDLWDGGRFTVLNITCLACRVKRTTNFVNMHRPPIFPTPTTWVVVLPFARYVVFMNTELDKYLRELDFSMNSLSLSLNLVNTAVPYYPSNSSSGKQCSNSSAQFSASHLLRASSRLQSMHCSVRGRNSVCRFVLLWNLTLQCSTATSRRALVGYFVWT